MADLYGGQQAQNGVRRLPESLPTYAWAGLDVDRLCDAHPLVPPLPLGREWPPIPQLFGDPSGASLPIVGSDARGSDEPLVPVTSERVRDLAAYWHSGWPHAVPFSTLRETVCQELHRACEGLPAGFGFAVFDAWRDPRLQSALHELAYRDTTLAPGFVSPPSRDPRTPPPHATGGTLDLTLTWHGVPLNLGTRFDEFVPKAHTRALEGVDQHPEELARNLRRLLRVAMTSVGFVQLDCEWWHFEYGTRLWAKIHDQQPLYPMVGFDLEESAP